MNRHLLRASLLCLLAVTAATADVTIRYSFTLKPSPLLPPEMADKLRDQMKGTIPEKGMVTQLKGNRAYSTGFGVSSISDFDGAMITIIDEKNKRFATTEAAAYMRAANKLIDGSVQVAPPENAMKVSTEVRQTGRKRTMHGVPSTETELAMSIPIQGAPVPMRASMSFWMADKEASSNPALREFQFFTQRAYEGTNPATMFEKVFASMPGFGTALKQLVDSMKDSPLMLAMHTSILAPGMDEPLMQMNMDLTELSTAEVPASVFEIPREFTAVSIEELLSSGAQSSGESEGTPEPRPRLKRK